MSDVGRRVSCALQRADRIEHLDGRGDTDLFAATVALPVSAASAPAPVGEASMATDLALPFAPRLREALASAYFGLSALIFGVVFFALAYLMLPRRNGAQRTR